MAVKVATASLFQGRRGPPSPGGRGVKLITVYLPESYLKALDELVEERYYPSRAEAIRVAIRDLLNKEFWGKEGEGRGRGTRGA